MAEINNAIALGVKPFDPLSDASKLAGTQQALSSSELMNQESRLKNIQTNALQSAGKLYGAGDQEGAVNALAQGNPEGAKTLQGVMQTGKQIRAQDTFGKTLNPKDVAAHPEAFGKTVETLNAMDANTRAQTLYHADLLGRSADAVLSAKPEDQERVWNDELRKGVKTGSISPDFFAENYGKPNLLLAEQMRAKALDVAKYRESFGQAAGASSRATLPQDITRTAAGVASQPLTITPNTVVAPGTTANPAMQPVIANAVQKSGLGGNNAPPSAIGPQLPIPQPRPPGAPGVPEGGTAFPGERFIGSGIVSDNGAPLPPGTSGGPVVSPPVAGAPPPTGPSRPFTPSVIRNPDGSIASSVTPGTEKMQQDAANRFGQAAENYRKSQDMSRRLDMMDHAVDTLNSAGWSSTGAGADAKLGAAKTVNSLFKTVGLPEPLDPNKVASWEEFNKETKQAGFELARTLGAGEAASIVNQGVSSVPNSQNTYLGAKLVTSSIRQAMQRESDYYQFATNWAQQNNGSTFGSEIEFNKKYPPALYAKTAVANALPTGATELLAKNPSYAKQFDTKYGPGMAKFILDKAQQPQ